MGAEGSEAVAALKEQGIQGQAGSHFDCGISGLESYWTVRACTCPWFCGFRKDGMYGWGVKESVERLQ